MQIIIDILDLHSRQKNLKLSSVRLRRLSEFSRGGLPAPPGRGEMRSNYFKNTAPRRNLSVNFNLSLK